MKLSDVQQHIDDYFANANPQEVIREFKEMGYEFEPLSDLEIYFLNKGYKLGFEAHFDGTLNTVGLLPIESYSEMHQLSGNLLIAAEPLQVYDTLIGKKDAQIVEEPSSKYPGNSNLAYAMAA